MTADKIIPRVGMWLSAALAGYLLAEAVAYHWRAVVLTLIALSFVWVANMARKDSL